MLAPQYIKFLPDKPSCPKDSPTLSLSFKMPGTNANWKLGI